ncbi:hypothetical protein N431DRAFT_560236 [Stipitochalara longipes BDJ]|nr:hypothetical protein N431DRAFT_560236 [Stipitochalara longipes BDJ]
MQPAEQTRTKRPRLGHHKSRLGCKTCKIRRVKCDETRPNCNRCLKLGIRCDGYLNKSANAERPVAKPRRLSPKGHALIPSGLPQIYITPSRLKFGTEQESRYFHLFCTETAKQLTGFFEEHLWQTIVLQACEIETPLRHAVIALGALGNSPLRRPKRAISLDRKFAFSEYSKAVSQIRHKVASWNAREKCSERDLRTTLISCLLFTCFETLNGCSDAAITQIYAGVRITEEWQLQYVRNSNELTPVSSPRPLVIEDELLHAFSRLELEAMTYKDFRASKVNKANLSWARSDMDRMPKSFTSLAEARIYLAVIVRRAMRFGAWVEKKNEATGAWAFYLHNPDSIKSYTEPEMDTRRILGEYEQWALAFEKMWMLSRTEAGKSLFEGATILRLMYVMVISWRKAVAKGGAQYVATAKREPREILTLAKELLDSVRSRGEEPGNFTFDMRVIVMLHSVGFVFRHRRMRRETIDLLLERPWREGLWDSWVTGKSMEWLADLEDEGLPSEEELEHIPRNRVCSDVKLTHDDFARTTTVSCRQPVLGVEGVSIPRKMLIQWL